LYPHGAVSRQRCEHESLTAKHHAGKSTRERDVVVNAFCEANQTTGVEPQGLAVKFLAYEGSARVNEGEAIA